MTKQTPIFIEQNPYIDYSALRAALVQELQRPLGPPPPPPPLTFIANAPLASGRLLARLTNQLRRWPWLYRIARQTWHKRTAVRSEVRKRPALRYAVRWIRWLAGLPKLADLFISQSANIDQLRNEMQQIRATFVAEQAQQEHEMQQIRTAFAAEQAELALALRHWASKLALVAEAHTALQDELSQLKKHPASLQPTGNAVVQPPSAREPLSAAMDRFYQDFEDAWRGPQAVIRERVSHYLPVVREAGAGRPEAPMVDLGCGRGEWLAVLNEAGLTAFGVDSNHTAVQRCRNQGLTVNEADLCEWIRSRQSGSLGGISALHVVEHLTFDVLIEMLDNALRALQPGGVLIMETPDPANMLVASQTFWLDPSHMRPIPADLLAFTAASRGFEQVRVERLHPADKTLHFKQGNEVGDRLNTLLYGPQDYVVIARKPS